GIVEHLKISEPGLRAEVRGRLDTIREFYLKGRLYQAATPSQAERNAALAVVKEGVGAFLNVISAFGAPPEWSLALPSPFEGPSPFRMFMTFPQRLRILASMARTAQSADEEYASLLRSLSKEAETLATTLLSLDHASKNDVMSHLPWT